MKGEGINRQVNTYILLKNTTEPSVTLETSHCLISQYPLVMFNYLSKSNLYMIFLKVTFPWKVSYIMKGANSTSTEAISNTYNQCQ